MALAGTYGVAVRLRPDRRTFRWRSRYLRPFLEFHAGGRGRERCRAGGPASSLGGRRPTRTIVAVSSSADAPSPT